MAAAGKKKKSGEIGLPPGTLVHVGDKKVEKAGITIMDFDEARCEEWEVDSVEECFPFKSASSITWINVNGLHDVSVIEKLGKGFDLHPLVMEDILNTAERPKMEDYGDYIFVILKVFVHGHRNHEDRIHQISLVLGQGYVLTFLEKENGTFEPVRERIRRGKGRIRRLGADYLAYALIDCIVDGYFGVLEKFGDDIEALEDDLVLDPKKEILQKIQNLKRDMIYLRKSVWPLREAIGGMERLDSPLIASATDVFLRDLYDHTIQIIDNVETSRDILSGMLETYLSSVSNRMNEVMKVLTIIATIFIPLTFIVGIYGMNFTHMPELGWKWGYPLVWLLMAVVAVLMVRYFKKKNWI